MNKQAILTYDLGTSSLKTCLWNWDGQVIRSEQKNYSTNFGIMGEATQNPQDWLGAVIETTSKIVEACLSEYSIEAIGFTGQMSGCLLVNMDGKVLYPAMTWQDRRMAEDMSQMTKIIEQDEFFSITGQRLDAGLPIAKLLWIKKNYPLILEDCRLIQAQDWLVSQFTGNIVTDITNASGTGLLDITKLQLSKEICERFDISFDILPDIVHSSSIVGHLTKAMSNDLNLPSGIPVVIGGGDGPSSALGLGITKKGQGYCQMGTSAWVSTFNDKPVKDLDSGLINYAYFANEIGYVPTGSMQSAGHSLMWAQNILGHEIDINYPKASSPYYFPYLLGERSPFWINESRGAFFKLSATHNRSDMYTAVLEGVIFQLRMIISRFRKFSLIDNKQPLVFSGGILSDQNLSKIVARSLEEDIFVLENPVSSTSLGAFYLTKSALILKDPLSLASSPKMHRIYGIDHSGIVAERYNTFFNLANKFMKENI